MTKGGNEGGGTGIFGSSRGSIRVKSEEDDVNDEDDGQAFYAMLVQIKKEIEEEITRNERQEQEQELKVKEAELLRGNPLLNGSTATSFNVKRKWDGDAVAQNQAHGDTKIPKRFINDAVRNDFHQKQCASSITLSGMTSTAQTGHATGGDWQEEVYQKVKVMKEIYLHKLSEMYQKIATKIQQHDSLPQQPESEKLKLFKTMLERLISVLQISKCNISPGLKEKLSLYEKQIVNVINTSRPRKAVSFLQQGQLQASGQEAGTTLQPRNVMDGQKQIYQSQGALHKTSLASLHLTAQTGHATGCDWQEEVYQKVKVMKEMYLPELSEMYQKIATKIQQLDSLPQQPKSEQLEKLRLFKTMLERLISVLQISKSNILPGFKEKLGIYERQIVNFITTNRPRKAVSSPQPGQVPPPHMHSMQQSQFQIFNWNP